LIFTNVSINTGRNSLGCPIPTLKISDDSDIVGQPSPSVLEPKPIEKEEKVSRLELTAYSGVIPHPSIIAGYEDILPGSADRILSMAEKEGEDRRSLEKKITEDDGNRAYLGLMAGFLIAVTGLGGSIYLGLKDKIWASRIMSAGTLTSLVTVFVKGKERRRAETEADEKDVE
jgi:uncharacterized membrane protein